MSKPVKQVHLGAAFPGVNSHTVWSDPRSGSFDLDVVGRPDTLTVLNTLAAVTDRIGLAGTINATFNEPLELARQFATLDHLSGGRSTWNVVTSSDAFTGENFRRGGFLAHADRYTPDAGRRAGPGGDGSLHPGAVEWPRSPPRWC